MQPYDQEPTEKTKPDCREEEVLPAAQASSTFSSENEASQMESSPDSGTKVLPEALNGPAVSSLEVVAPGISYPPPPEYYEQMTAVVEKKFQLPIVPPKPPQPLPVVQPVWAAPVSTGEPWNQPGSYPPASLTDKPGQNKYYAPGQAYPIPPYRGRSVARKRPNKWVWIMASVLGVILLTSCGLVVWSVSNWVSPAVQQLFDGVQTVNNYYDALQAKNYVAAYRMLALEGKQSNITQAQFTQQAQALDKQEGVITAHAVGQPTVGSNNNTDTGTDVTEFTVQVNVTRGQQQYTVNLDLKLIGGSWKVVSYDRL